MNDFQSSTTTALSRRGYFPDMRANRQKRIWTQALNSGTKCHKYHKKKKSQAGVNDEHTRTHVSRSKKAHMPDANTHITHA